MGPAALVGQGARARRLLAFVIWYPTTLDRYWQSVLFFPVGIYILLALGLNIVVGHTGLLDLGYVAFFAVGAYTTAKLTADDGWFTAWEVLLLAIVVGHGRRGHPRRPDAAPARRLPGHRDPRLRRDRAHRRRRTAAASARRGASPASPTRPSSAALDFGTNRCPTTTSCWSRSSWPSCSVARLKRSRVGRAWAAIREDEDAAESMGVPTFKMKLWAFAMGASIGGLGGLDLRHQGRLHQPRHLPVQPLVPDPRRRRARRPGLDPGRHRRRLRRRLPARVPARDAGGEACSTSSTASPAATPATSPSTAFFLFGLALVLMMIFRPQGLLPSRQRAAELAEATSTAAAMGATVAAGEDVVDEVDEGRRPPRDVPTDVELPRTPSTARRRGGRGGARARRAHHGLRRRGRPQRRLAHGPPGPDLRHHRSERRRQDDGVQLRDRRVPAHGGRHHARRPSPSPAEAAPDHRGRRRPHVPEHPPLPEHDRAREHHGRHRRPAHDERARRARWASPVLPGGAARARPRPCGCSEFVGIPHRGERPPATCPTATSAGWRSPGPSPPSRRSCSSTSRPPASTRRRSRRSSG